MKGNCLVGCGRIGRTHARNLSGRAELYFCSRSRSSAEKLQRDFEAGRHAEAIEGQREVNRLLETSSRVSWPLAGKAIWQAWGLPVQPVVRAPCDQCSPEAIREVQDIFGPMQDIAG